ncbi:mitochondrial uncoupling protein 4 isoform X1 [Ictalurus punctatus]|uniref:Mitochondrial uncoupling protein 4 n=1 Tax=Ictalurus punctatus TaxID=7998 RepID=A0A2D0R1H8_ICTPU|nr:mitochondrial uncoupling protein 4 isoform X1 [Ictalurus punctatus]XP_017324407.1 mitochondrial uncoupling protein 4 isoform X1 [Ictalurus punctatus]XP_017324408.1 mitochondrial uncoupling protein 4 isoform X1 [Ictalurus punctatus]XP_017324409.1 mitochondrial uncoupling protein 4 isoform X1 [Ictalurus punctatus]
MGPVQEISQWPKVSKFAVSACAASVAELVTFPLDLTKTRLQIQGEYAPEKLSKSGTVNTVYRGMLSTAVGIVREEGPLKLWQGATPAIYRHIVYSGGRMLAYEQLRDFVLGKSEDGSFPLWKAAFGGMVSGALGQFLASPTDLVKVQMQMEGKRRLEGKPPRRVHGVIHGFVKIAKEGGIRGLWAGWVPNVQRAALVNLGDLTTYDSVKHILLRNTSIEDNCLCHGLASTCSGLVAAMMGTPADVVKTRIMNQPLDSNGRGLLYKSSIDCLVQSVRAEGLRTLYKGFVPTWLRMAPWSMTFWLTFEQIRHAVGISSF